VVVADKKIGAKIDNIGKLGEVLDAVQFVHYVLNRVDQFVVKI
jgi:hypothetical protein